MYVQIGWKEDNNNREKGVKEWNLGRKEGRKEGRKVGRKRGKKEDRKYDRNCPFVDNEYIKSPILSFYFIPDVCRVYSLPFTIKRQNTRRNVFIWRKYHRLSAFCSLEEFVKQVHFLFFLCAHRPGWGGIIWRRSRHYSLLVLKQSQLVSIWLFWVELILSFSGKYDIVMI